MEPQSELNESPFSLGTAPLLPAIDQLAGSREPPSLLLINLHTIVRNAGTMQQVVSNRKETEHNGKSTKPAVGVWQDRALKEIGLLKTELCGILQQHPGNHFDVIFYYTDYDRLIPKQVRKVPTGVEEFQLQVDPLVFKSLGSNFAEHQASNLNLLLAELDSSAPVAKQLVKLTDRYARRPTQVVMVSHHPVDYHCLQEYQHFLVLKSFTGQLTDRQGMSQKAFRTTVVPFIQETQLLLGDGQDVIASLNLKERKRLITVCTEKKLALRTRDQIVTVLQQQNFHYPNVKL